jgi:hypothetical protein
MILICLLSLQGRLNSLRPVFKRDEEGRCGLLARPSSPDQSRTGNINKINDLNS